MGVWDILGIIAVIVLVASFFIGKNAIWGTLTAGAVIGLIVCLIIGFTWPLYKKILIISTLVGLFFELLGRLPKFLRERKISREANQIVDAEMQKEFPKLYNRD